MKCLSCGEPVVALEFTNFEVDTCLNCGGIWLDSGELEMLLGSRIPDKLLNQRGGSSRSKRKCPVCGRRMDTATVGPTNITEIDSCPVGHGLWFDRGEMETIVELIDEPLKSAVLVQLRAIFSRDY